MPSPRYYLTVTRWPRDMVRLLLVQIGVLAGCLGLGLALYWLPVGDASLLLAATVCPAACLWPSCRRWLAAVIMAAGLMYLTARSLPAVWLQGPLFVGVSLASAAVGVWLLTASRSV